MKEILFSITAAILLLTLPNYQANDQVYISVAGGDGFWVASKEIVYPDLEN